MKNCVRKTQGNVEEIIEQIEKNQIAAKRFHANEERRHPESGVMDES